MERRGHPWAERNREEEGEKGEGIIKRRRGKVGIERRRTRDKEDKREGAVKRGKKGIQREYE